MKIAIVGQAPSRTSDPAAPLSGPVGQRVRRLLKLSDEEWARAFKANAVERFPGKLGRGDAFPLARARREVARLSDDLAGRLVFVLGKRTAKALGVEPTFLQLSRGPRFDSIVVPHPSGVNRWWNDPANRRRAQRAIGRVLRGD